MRTALYLSFLLAVTSCISNKRINYLQNLPENEAIELDEFIPYAKVDYEYVLQPFDIVDIDFASPNEELLKAFEFTGTTNARVNSAMTGGDVYFHSGYSIDKNGYVRMPVIGLVEIAGLTEEKAREKIEGAVNAYFKEQVYVRLRTGGIRFTALGEFSSVGTKMILKNRATIFDALALSGESNILAKKNELFVMRQYYGATMLYQINRKELQNQYYNYYISPISEIL